MMPEQLAAAFDYHKLHLQDIVWVLVKKELGALF
jgi:hypothetical protein